MGGALSGLSNTTGSLYGGLGGITGGGVNNALSPFGLGGEQGEYFQGNTENRALQDYLAKIQGFDPRAEMTGSTEDVMNNAILGRTFGKGGLQEQTLGDLSKARGEEADLSSRGFSLTPDDHEAYGQASGDIARMFGQSEQDLSQSLANRGLSQGPSGAAGAAFSGLQGNKQEQLAKAQTNIANQRMQNNLARLNSTRQFMSQLGGLGSDLNRQGQTAIESQYQARHQPIDDLGRAAGLQMQQNAAANEAGMASLQDKRGSAGKTLFDAFGRGLFKATEAAPQKAAGGLFG